MDSYICINGKKTELTLEQLKALGIAQQRTYAEICEIVRSGKAREVFGLHGIIDADGYTLEVIGFDHDKSANDHKHTMTVMAKELLPAHRMHSGACKRGWMDTELRKWLNGDVLKTLPEELVRHIVPVVKSTHASDGEVYETRDKLFLPSESELFGSAIWSDYEDGPRYEAFATSSDRMREDEDGDGYPYWSRSFLGGNSTYCASVGNPGNAYYSSASDTSIRAPLCFCFA